MSDLHESLRSVLRSHCLTETGPYKSKAPGGYEYVFITFKPHGATRKRSTFAIKLRPGVYIAVDKEGEKQKEKGRDAEGRQVIQTEYILAPDAIEKPAQMNLHYAELEVIK